MKAVSMMSSGAGSWASSKLTVEKYGADNVTLLFCDVKGDDAGPHDGEDADNYRFLEQAAANVGAKLVTVRDGRNVWDVFRDEHMIGNSRIAPCSKRLKQVPARRWIEANCDPADTVLVVGIDWSEEHRLPAVKRGWEPYQVEAPLCDPPYRDKAQILDWLKAEGIEPPRLYAQGFAHANCGGFCVRGGQGHFQTLLEQNRERYLYHEEQEEKFRAGSGRDVSILRDRSLDMRLSAAGLTRDDIDYVTEEDSYYVEDGYEHVDRGEQYMVHADTMTVLDLPKVVPLTLHVLRNRIEGGGEVDALDIGGCGCFLDTEDPA